MRGEGEKTPPFFIHSRKPEAQGSRVVRRNLNVIERFAMEEGPEGN